MLFGHFAHSELSNDIPPTLKRQRKQILPIAAIRIIMFQRCPTLRYVLVVYYPRFVELVFGKFDGRRPAERNDQYPFPVSIGSIEFV